MATWDIKDLEYWDEKIREKVGEFGLSCYPQEFEVCDYFQMLGYMVYSGMPSHYPHWSYGKSYEKLNLQLEYAERTLAYLERLWGHETILETTVNGTDMILSYNDKGFTSRLR
jgi:spore cortex formation protein SpoVR/YcgB (stage V sporulation)